MKEKDDMIDIDKFHKLTGMLPSGHNEAPDSVSQSNYTRLEVRLLLTELFHTLEAENKRLIKNVSKAMSVLQELYCSGCKDCEDSCPYNILIRLLNGENPTKCPVCDEWWDGPVEFNEHGACEFTCPECLEFQASEETSDG